MASKKFKWLVAWKEKTAPYGAGFYAHDIAYRTVLELHEFLMIGFEEKVDMTNFRAAVFYDDRGEWVPFLMSTTTEEYDILWREPLEKMV
jgi:hypothetical protein